jgi:hypothetical protein
MRDWEAERQENLVRRLEERAAENMKQTETEAKLCTAVVRMRVGVQPTGLEKRLLEKLGSEAWERANNLASTPTIGSNRALELARAVGAADMLGQLVRMEEADRVLQLAWEAGAFDDCVFYRVGREVHQDLDSSRLEETRVALRERAIELLAEQYGDLHVKVTRIERWTDMRRLKLCPVRTLGGPEGGGSK